MDRGRWGSVRGGGAGWGGDKGGEMGGMDELNEITAYLQSELVRHADPTLPSVALLRSTSSLPPDSSGPYAAPRQNGQPTDSRLSASAPPTLTAGRGPTSTILVTETNLPYLQHFLPNLQTVMQSVQSYVASRSPTQHDTRLSPPRLTQAVTSAEAGERDGCRLDSMKRKVDEESGGELKKAAEGRPAKLPNGKTDAHSVAAARFSTNDVVGREVEGGGEARFYCRFCKLGFASLEERRRHTKFSCGNREELRSIRVSSVTSAPS